MYTIYQLLAKKNAKLTKYPIVSFDKRKAKKRMPEFFDKHLELLRQENITVFIIADEVYALGVKAIKRCFELFPIEEYKIKFYCNKKRIDMIKFLKTMQSIHLKNKKISKDYDSGVLLHNKDEYWGIIHISKLYNVIEKALL